MRTFHKVRCQQTDCPRYAKKHFIPCESVREDSTSSVDILFIGDQPTSEDVNVGQPFSGQQGQLIRKIGEFTLGSDNKVSIAYTYLVRCRSESNLSDALPRCSQFYEKDIEELNPKLLVIQGAAALSTLVPGASNIAQERGSIHKIIIKEKEYSALVTWHPGYVMVNTSTLPLFAQDIGLAYQLVQGLEHNEAWSKKGEYSIIKTVSEVKDYTEHLLYGLQKTDYVAFDVETRNLFKRPQANKLGLLQFATDENRGYCIPFEHPETPFSVDELEKVRQYLAKLFTEKPSFGGWIVHGGVFEQIQVRGKITLGKTIRNAPWYDTEGMMYLLDENRALLAKEIGSVFGLKKLARELLLFNHYDIDAIKARSGESENTATIQGITGRVKSFYNDDENDEDSLDSKLLDLPLDRLCDYGAMDAYVTYRLFWYLIERAFRDNYKGKIKKLSEHLFARAYRLFSVMSMNGFYVDLKHLRLLASKQSPILKRMDELNNLMKNFDSAKKANDILEKKNSGGQKALFGKPWVYTIDQKSNNAVLLYQVLKLDPPVDDLPKEYVLRHRKRSNPEWAAEAWKEAIADGHVPPVNKTVYDMYAEEYEEVQHMQEYAAMKKLATSYVNNLLKFVSPEAEYPDGVDFRIRPDFKFTKVVTGRTSAQNPNTQQIPRADNPSKAEIKNMLKAEQGERWFDEVWIAPVAAKAKHRYKVKHGTALVQLDFMANEVRWWSIIAKDPDLAKAFNDGKGYRERYAKLSAGVDCSWSELSIGKKIISIHDSKVELDKHFAEYAKKTKDSEKLNKYKKNLDAAVDRILTDKEFSALCEAAEMAEIAGDIHKLTASLMFQVPIKQVKKEMRQATKNIVFGWMYGRSTKSIAIQLKNPNVDEVQKLCDKFGGQFKRAADWLTEIEEFAEKNSFVESPIGRRRRLSAFLTNNQGLIAEAKRQARNSPIQGVASDAAIIGSSLFSDYIEDNELPWLVQNAVHDSSVIQVPVTDIEECIRTANKVFTTDTMKLLSDVWGLEFNCSIEVEFEVSQAPKHAWGALEKWDFSNQNMRHLCEGAKMPLAA